MADDDIDVKAEGQARTKRQQQGMRDTAEDEEYARGKRTRKGWNKKAANDSEMYSILATDPNTPSRKKEIRRGEYLIRTTGNDRRSRKAGKKKATRKRVSGK